jgi:glycosyltransferase involved in cell wall biosynthesis
MIVKDEETVLERCLDSVMPFADELIIVDTGSTDRTMEIARGYTEKLFEFRWIDDFSAARNYSYSFAACDFVMWIDADEYVQPEDREKIRDLKKTLDSTVKSVITKWERSGRVSWHERMERRASRPLWRGRLHEIIDVRSPCIQADILIRETKKPEYSSIEFYRRIIDSIIESGEALTTSHACQYAWDYIRAGREEEGERLFLRAVREAPNPADRALASIQLADFYTGAGRYPDAIAVLETIPPPTAGASGDEAERRELIYFGACQKLAKCRLRTGDIEGALRCNELAAKLRPDSISVRLNQMFLEGINKGS